MSTHREQRVSGPRALPPLTEEETVALGRISSRPTEPHQFHGRQHLRLFWRIYLFAGAALAIVIISATGIAVFRDNASALLAAQIGLLVGAVAVFGAFVFGFYETRRVSKRLRTEKTRDIQAYLASVGYPDRVASYRQAAATSGHWGASDGSPSWHVLGYTPGMDRGRFSSGDRQRMNDAGMSADEYRNNVQEAD